MRLVAIVRKVSCHGEDAIRMKRVASRFSMRLFAAMLTTSVPVAHAREVNMQEAVAQAQREAEGKVLSVQTLNVGKHKVYRIKILTRDGQVRIVQVPAEQ